MPNFLKTATVAEGPVPLSAVPLICRRALITACKGLDGPTASPNADVVFLGGSPTAGEQPIEMSAGDERVYNAPANGRLDLSKIFLAVATNNDGVAVDYE